MLNNKIKSVQNLMTDLGLIAQKNTRLCQYFVDTSEC